MKRHLAAVTLGVVAATLGGCGTNRPVTLQAPAAQNTAAQTDTAITAWFCPMHSNQTSDAPGKCPICGMALVAGDPFDTRDYLLEVETEPAAVAAGVPFKLFVRVRHPGTRAIVTEYRVVHDKQYHLFVISHDLSFFQHLHPERGTDGSWQIELTVPKAGYYRILSDFAPSGSAPQFLGRTLVTADFHGDLESQTGRLEADRVFTKTGDTITAAIAFEPPQLIAGQYGHLQFTLTDAKTGQSVTDLQPYLGAFGHTLIVSEDMLDYVHSHPTEGPEHDASKGFGGPRVSFEGHIPRPGRYRSWTQFLRNDQLTTVSFTFNVLSPDDAMRTER